MKLYRLEETRKPTAKKPWEWRACRLDGHRWVPEGNACQVKQIRDNWVANMFERAALEMGIETESRPGYYCTYFLVREPWPEQVIEDLVAKVESLESEVRGLLMREDD